MKNRAAVHCMGWASQLDAWPWAASGQAHTPALLTWSCTTSTAPAVSADSRCATHMRPPQSRYTCRRPSSREHQRWRKGSVRVCGRCGSHPGGSRTGCGESRRHLYFEVVAGMAGSRRNSTCCSLKRPVCVSRTASHNRRTDTSCGLLWMCTG
jgi:hypothetical protein